MDIKGQAGRHYILCTSSGMEEMATHKIPVEAIDGPACCATIPATMIMGGLGRNSVFVTHASSHDDTIKL